MLSSNDKQSKNEAPVSLLYDDALPLSLKKKGLEAVQGKRILPRQEQGEPSPYIVHLSRTEESQPALTHAQRIEQLANELIIEEGEESGAISEQDDLLLTLDDLAAQLREPDIDTTPALKTSKVQNTESVDEPSKATAEPIVIANDDLVEAPVEISTEPVKEAVDIEEETTRFLPKLSDRLSLLPSLLPTRVRHRAIASFVALSMAVVLPLQAMQSIVHTSQTRDNITEIGANAVEQLQRGAHAAETQRFDIATSDFTRAGEQFAQAQRSLEDMHLAVAALVNIIPQTDRTYETVRGLVSAGKNLSEAAALFSEAGDALAQKESLSLTEKINLFSSYVEKAQPHIEDAQSALEVVNTDLIPSDKRAQVEELKSLVPTLNASIADFLTFSDTLNTLLGGEQKMRYLVSFQNNTELRPTGGFTGSFAEMDLVEGAVEQVHIPKGGTYDLQGQLSTFVHAPEPLSLINSRWEFHDANWFPDFPSSAQKMVDFYQAAGGPTVDGVIALNATLIPELLTITGPIEMPEYDRTITAENFLFETQKIVEYEYTQYETDQERQEEAPKQFIGDLAPRLLSQLQEADTSTLLAFADVLGRALSQKDIQIYLQDNELQRHIQTLGWAGNVKQTSGDYFMLVNTNLGGGKTDSVIYQDVEIDVDIQENGDIINTVTITKEHRGLSDAIFEGANNVDYLRIYTPRGSELLDADGFEIPPQYLFEESDLPLEDDEDLQMMTSDYAYHASLGVDEWVESGKTVFGSWMQTAPGETETVTFSYRLPWRIEMNQSDDLLNIAKERIGLLELERYSLLVQKQSGVTTRQTAVHLHTPESMEVVWTSDDAIEDPSGAVIDNTQDHLVHLLLKQ